MAFDGSVTITLVDKNPRLAKVVVAGFDADGENLIDILTLFLADFYKVGIRKNLVPRTISWWTTSTHATEVVDTVSIKLMASLRPLIADAIWIELGEITDSDLANADTTTATSADVTEAAFPTQSFTQFDIDCITVGAGNTHSVHLLVGFGDV